jgi:hypothetical protein
MDYYVLRTNGAITGLLSQPPKNGEPVELLPDSNPEVVAYLATSGRRSEASRRYS